MSVAPFDGNAIAGLLADVFGGDMTAAASACSNCGDRRPLAEAAVYTRAPGTVVRCRSCLSILMVLVTIRGVTCVDVGGLAALDVPASRET